MEIAYWRRLGRWVGAALVAGALTACTGTQEDTLPTLLLVGDVGPNGPRMSVLEDVFDPGGAPPRRIEPVAGSERPLLAPPLSVDMADRNGGRSELVVLVRDDDAEIAGLHFFDVSALDPSAPAAFAPSRDFLDLFALLRDEALAGESPCLTSVQVDDEGRYAALADDGRCRSTEIPDVHLVDLVEQAYLGSIGDQVRYRPLAAGIFLDQADDRLYFAHDEIGSTAVVSVTVPEMTDAATIGEVPLDLATARTAHLAPAGAGIALLADRRLAFVPRASTSDAIAVSDSVSGARRILPDPVGSLDEVVVFGDTRLAIHDAPGLEEVEELRPRLPPVAATLEPLQRFAYLLEAGGIEILDLFPYAESPGSGRLLFREVPGLADPRVISWVYATGSAAP